MHAATTAGSDMSGHTSSGGAGTENCSFSWITHSPQAKTPPRHSGVGRNPGATSGFLGPGLRRDDDVPIMPRDTGRIRPADCLYACRMSSALLACPHCDLLQREVAVRRGALVRCCRCHMVLDRPYDENVDRPL